MGKGRPIEVDIKIESQQELIKKLFIFGLTDIQVCDIIGIGESSLNRYKEKKPEIWESLKKGKELADIEVVASLYKKATGYEYEELQQEGTMQKEGNSEKLKVKSVRKTKKHIPPDTTAIIYWLRNRQGWIDKIDMNTSPPEAIPELENKTDAELDQTIEKLQKKNGNGNGNH